MAKSLEIFDSSDYVGGGGKTLWLNFYEPQKVPAKSGELWMSFVNQPSKAPFKIGSVTAGQIVQISLTADEPVRLYLVSHDAAGRRISLGFTNAKTIEFAPNKEKLIPIITQDGAALNAEVNFIASNYSEKTRFRKIQYADDADFETNLVETYQSFQNAQGVITPNFAITRTTNLSNSQTVYVRIAHSSNNLNFDKWSEPVQVTFANSGGGGGSGGGTTPGTVAPPSNLGLSQSAGIVTLTWQNNGGDGNNVIERKINSDGWAELNEVASNLATTTDTPTTPGTNIFYYRVKNRNVAGYSNEENITVTVAGGGGSAPTNFQAETNDIDDTEVQIDFSWVSNSNSGNIVLERRLSLDAPWSPLDTLSPTAESYQQTVFRLSVNRTYYYRLSNSSIAEYREVSVFVGRYIPPRFEE